MKNLQRFVFLSQTFHSDFPTEKFPEIEKKENRPYIQIIVDIKNIRFAISLRSHINHPYVFWTDKENGCGVDFTKAVVISKDEYIDSEKIPHLRQNEFDALRGKDFKIKKKMEKYIEDFKTAKNNLENPINKMIYNFSSLKYFEDVLGL